MDQSTAIAVSPQQLMRQAADVAGVCKEIVMRTAKPLGNRKFVPVEGWQAIATAHGCALSIDLVEKIETGFRAVASVRRHDTGASIAVAEGFVGNDEPSWAKRPEYAKRAMAQTRAMSRAARSAFAHVVVLISNDLSTTPAEEMPDDHPDPAPAPATAPRPQPAPVPAPAPAPKPAEPAQPPVENTQAKALAEAKKIADEIKLIDRLARQAGARDRGEVMAACSRIAGRSIKSSTELNKDERAAIIAALTPQDAEVVK